MSYKNKVDIVLLDAIACDEDLKGIVGASHMSRPEFLVKFSGVMPRTNFLPRLSYFSGEKGKGYGIHKASEFTIMIQDDDQERLEEIGNRIITRLTGPYRTKATEAQLINPHVKIGLIKVISDDDSKDDSTQVYMTRIVFDISYVPK